MRRVSANPYLSHVLNIKSAKRSRRVIENNIKIFSSGAVGTRVLTNEDKKRIRRVVLSDIAKNVGYFELVWYPFFVLLDLLCLVFIPFSVFLAINVLQLLVFMTASDLTARGNRWGLFLNSISLLMYSFIAFKNAVWGEMIINLAFYIPLELTGFFRWKKVSSGGSLLYVGKLTKQKWAQGLVALTFLSSAIFLVLNFLLHQEFAIVNAVAISACLVGDYCRNSRYLEAWLFFTLCDLLVIVLWLLEIYRAGGTGVGFEVLPMVIGYFSALTSNFNGLNIWRKIEKRTKDIDGLYLAKHPVSINSFARFKRPYLKYVCYETDDVLDQKFRKGKR